VIQQRQLMEVPLAWHALLLPRRWRTLGSGLSMEKDADQSCGSSMRTSASRS
jgi:hypothetical protein